VATPRPLRAIERELEREEIMRAREREGERDRGREGGRKGEREKGRKGKIRQATASNQSRTLTQS